MFHTLSRFLGLKHHSDAERGGRVHDKIVGAGGSHISEPPRHVEWRKIRPKEDNRPVRAVLANHDGGVQSDRGALRYRAGAHYIVRYGDGDCAPVERLVFERSYRERADGLYEKRTDIELRYFTLNHAVYIGTLEGARLAEPGDWIVEGAAGELWPVDREDALQKYEEI